MLSITSANPMTRREILRVGGLGFPGLWLSDWLAHRATASPPAPGQAEQRRSAGSFGKAKACILIFNYGGPSHIDVLDPKPDAPVEIRGDFQPIATAVPGMAITEHLPRLARAAGITRLLAP